jgi:hypothetical protein
MSRSWDDDLRPKERANLIRRLHRVWVADLTLDEVCGEMTPCLRCRRGMDGDAACGLCGGSGVMVGYTPEIVAAMAQDIGLPVVRPESSYCPDEAAIRLAKVKLKMGWSNAQIEASLRGTIPSGGANARGAPENRSAPGHPSTTEG